MSRRVALLGAGLAARAHLRALRATGCEVVSAATRDEGRHGVVREFYPDAQRLWPAPRALEPEVNLALVLAPPNVHLELVELAAARGIDVLVEKPLDVSAGRAARLVRAAEDGGIGVAVCFQHRAKKAARALRETVASGKLGTLVGGTLTVPWWRPQEYYDEPGRGTFDRDGGGVLITQAVHALDLLLCTIGLPARVAAVSGTSPVHRLPAEDTLGGLLDYGGGVAVSLHATTAANPGGAERITLVGSGGTAELDGSTLTVHTDGSQAPTLVVAEEASATGADPSAMPEYWHRTILEDALRAFDTGGTALADGRSALGTQRVVEALYQAARSGAWVDLADIEDAAR